jgi:NAD(P)-dependent dehydrogenase (short-subunit alcohol dehydrogenase family)
VDLGLEGKVVLVTGGTDGLGLALCRGLAAEGARVACCGRDAARVEEAASLLRQGGAEVEAVAADVTVPDDLNRFVGRAMERWQRVDGLVNNAGRSAATRVADTTDGEWEDDLSLKLLAAVRLTRLVLPHLRVGGGSIVNVLAIGAKAPAANSAPSSVSRAAGLALTKALSRELGPDNIRVNAVLIGLVTSGQWRRMAAAQGIAEEDLYQRLTHGSDIPLGRVGRAEEFADTVAFLLSERASYVTGSALNIDGGLCAVT